MRRLVLLFLLTLPGTMLAQTFSMITQREVVTPLDGLWRFHTGDNPAWADPNFDDSQWPLLRSDQSWAAQGNPNYGGYAWYRFTLQVSDGSKPHDLLLTRIMTGYQVYADGTCIGGEGSIVPNRNEIIAYLPAIYRLPQKGAAPQSIHIAIRVWHDAAFGLPGGMQQPGSIAGPSRAVAEKLAHDVDARTAGQIAPCAYCLLVWVVGLAILLLYFSRLQDREYLWFALLLLASGVFWATGIAGNYVSLPNTLGNVISDEPEAISIVAALLFFSTVLRTRRSFFWWLACIGRVSAPLGLLIYYLGWLNWGQCHVFGIIFMLPADIWFVGTLAASLFRKGTPVRWLLAPAVLNYGLNFLGHLNTASVQLGWRKTWMPLDFALTSHPITVNFSDLLGYVFVLSLLIFLVRRFSATRQQEARLSQEMEAARNVQSLLIPAAPAAIPGFAVEQVYRPAHEVGGDFFQILPAPDNSLLIVVGDVSGKGLQAAMTVSAIVGALRDWHDRRPARVLAHLNRVLCGQITGFVTCSVTLVENDGAMTVANAGHLSPYRNGDELPLGIGLPLGILAQTSYEETLFHLAPNDRLTFLSDGVVEAQSPTGELFGFDRTRDISTQSAEAIAAVAQAHGQEDDITVLTLTFAPAEVPHA